MWCNQMEKKMKQRTLDLLLDFSALTEGQQEQFIASMNAFLFASPAQRRLQVGQWLEQRRGAGLRDKGKAPPAASREDRPCK